MTDRPTHRPADRPDAPDAERLHVLYARWRAAEGGPPAGEPDGEAADRALGALFAALPLEAPAPGFAARVLAARRRAAVSAPAAAPAPALVPAPAGRLAAAVLAALSLGTLFLAHLATTLLPPVEVGEGVRRLTLGAAGLIELLAAAVLAAERLAGYALIALEVLRTPEVAAVMLSAALSAALGLRFLMTLLARDRSKIHVRLD